MSLRLRMLNAMLRSFVKPNLARTRRAETMRKRLQRGTSLLPDPPSDVTFYAARLKRRDAGDPSETLAVRWCRLNEREAPRQATLYLHGGAYLAGSSETHRSVIWSLAKASGAPVVSLDYRLAPENPFPAAFDDAMDAFDALTAELGPGARVALAGDSAGGGLALAAAAALSARAQRRGCDATRPAAVAVFSPFADLALTGRSLKLNARRDSMLPAHRVSDAVKEYLAGADPRDPRASPLYADWSAPPPTLIQASQSELLRDDATRMAEKLRAAGGDVRLEMWRGTPHAWQFFAPWVPEARQAVASAGRFLATQLKAPEAKSGDLCESPYGADDAGD